MINLSLSAALEIPFFGLLGVHLIELFPQSDLFFQDFIWLFVLNYINFTEITRVSFLWV
jgi:hypothetical protein